MTPVLRGQTSRLKHDLSYGGTRGYQNSYLVDGTDDNNSFFAQYSLLIGGPGNVQNAYPRSWSVV